MFLATCRDVCVRVCGDGRTPHGFASCVTPCNVASLSTATLPLPLPLGLYTSPHLVDIRERIRLDGVPIPEAKYLQYFWEVWDALVATKVRCVCVVPALCLRCACAVPALCLRCACVVPALCLRFAALFPSVMAQCVVEE
jgi:hypothetical protein